ncbi:Zinc finger CCCH domain-containing protein 6 [Linum perenne]
MVRLFLSDESPSQVGGGAQDHLQAKASWVSHLTGTANDDVLPPGFELGQPSNQSQIKASDVPVIKWRCPPRFLLDIQWQVVAGEESQDVEAQNQREIRVLEAVYPRPSAIPTNPALPGGMEGSQHNGHRVPIIPITPVEDEEPYDSMGSMTAQPQSSTPGFPPQFGSTSSSAAERMAAGGLPHDGEPDALAAASAAFAAISRSNEQGSLIDHELLVKILSNPNLMEKLVKDHGAASTVQSVSDPLGPVIASSSPSQYYNGRTESSGPAFYGPANTTGREATGPNVQQAIPSPPFMNIPPPAVATGGQQVKDFSYYKSLIQQHGGERQDRYGQQQQPQQQQQRQPPPQDQIGYLKSRDSKTKIMKPCMYFNSPRGCRNGANCAYQHDAAPQQRGSGISAEMQSSKRMKMDREISS